ncbi:MAG: zinc-dependent peptidase [Crocinitomicaceae bacterium]
MGFFDLFRSSKGPRFAAEFTPQWRNYLNEKVQFYRSLRPDEKPRFEYRVLQFLNTTEITGIQTEVLDEDRLLIGASAIIPIFAFPKWEYFNLKEVLLYPSHFDFEHNIGQRVEDVAILGMVGYGYMEGKMILSRNALHLGYDNEEDKRNTAIHEFVHLIDKADGRIDGIPERLMHRENVIPWIHLIDEKIKEILDGDSDINSYGATNRSEFMAVISEYFFERPKLLERNHPELYQILEDIFAHELADRKLVEKMKPVRHFEPCPCGSGEKFRDCCMVQRQ